MKLYVATVTRKSREVKSTKILGVFSSKEHALEAYKESDFPNANTEKTYEGIYTLILEGSETVEILNILPMVLDQVEE